MFNAYKVQKEGNEQMQIYLNLEKEHETMVQHRGMLFSFLLTYYVQKKEIS